MSETSTSRASDAVLPPRLSGKQKVVYFATSNASASKQLWAETAFTGAPAGTAPTGKVFVTVGALTADVFVCFSGTSKTATTSTCWPIPAGGQTGFWIDTNVDTYISFITASAAGSIYWYVSSPEYESTGFTGMRDMGA